MRPPKLAQMVLQKTISRDIRYSAMGDFEEGFYTIAEEQGGIKAGFWYWGQCFKSLPSFVMDTILWSLIMLLNYIKIAFRNMRKHKLDTLLNISGLSLGIACSILILFHISDELSYDRFFTKADRIFRVTCEMREGDNTRHWATTDPVLATYISERIPEIENTCRMFAIPPMVLSYQPENDLARRFEESSGFFADQSSIDIFDFKFIKGNPETALIEVNSIVLTESMAEKYFSNENPLGKAILIGADGKENPVKVTGIINDLPSNSHMQFKYLLSYPTFIEFLRGMGREDMATIRGWAALYNYVLLKDKNLKPAADARFPDFTAEHFAGRGAKEEVISRIKFKLQPIVDIHLHSKLEQEIKANSDINYVYIFSAIALFIMIIAGVNYVNITTAQALKRMKEVGVRKILGARYHQLYIQIIGESLLLIFITTLIALLLLEAFLPLYNEITGKYYIFTDIFSITNTIIFVSLILTFGIIASVYPAFYISNFNPVQSIKGIREPFSSAAKTREGLVIFQFAISVFMIFSTIIIYQQMNYFVNTNLGFDKENVLTIKLNNELQLQAIKNPETLKNELYENPSILSASVVSNMPGDRLSVEHLRVDGAGDINERIQFRFVRTDIDYLKTLNLELIDGRDFTESSATNSAFIISEQAAKELKIDEPVGRMGLGVFGTRGEIVGVVKDFHFSSLQNIIEPLVIEYFPAEHQMKSVFSNYLLLKITGDNIPETLDFIKTKIEKIAPASLFVYSFLEQDLNKLYESESHVSDMFKAFALFAIFISCLGLFGLSSFSAQLRVKEIGVRKALGASVANIVGLLSKNYMLWILIANAIALPLAWIFMGSWLNSFAYRIQIGLFAFVFSIVISLGLALVTVSYQAIKAAYSNPVDSLRYE